MPQSGYIHIDVEEILRASEKALLCRLTDTNDNQEVWLPFSQIADPDEYYAGIKGCTISVKEWLANEKGLKGGET